MNDEKDQMKVTTLIWIDIFLAKSTLFLPRYFPIKKVADCMKPTGIIYVKSPIFLKMVCAAVIVVESE